MAWMWVFDMINTGLLGPNRTAIQREYGLSSEAFGGALAVLQIVCAAGLLLLAAATLALSWRLSFLAVGAISLVLLVFFAAARRDLAAVENRAAPAAKAQDPPNGDGGAGAACCGSRSTGSVFCRSG